MAYDDKKIDLLVSELESESVYLVCRKDILDKLRACIKPERHRDLGFEDAVRELTFRIDALSFKMDRLERAMEVDC